MKDTLTVVYVLGTARSGSTLLTRLLCDAWPDAFAAGEIRLLWRELDRRTCGCGVLARDCPVWSEVVDRSTVVDTPPDAVRGLLDASTRMQHLPAILRAGDARDRLPDGARRAARHLGETYRRVAAATGARVIVDSSKSVAEAALLRFVPGLRPVVVHIVRDPRAVAYSWHRALDQGAEGTPEHPTWSVALRWVLTNVASEAVSRRYGPDAAQVRYEDLVSAPDVELARLADLIGPRPAPPAADARRASHIVGGNALRRSPHRIEVREDAEWRRAQRPAISGEIAGLTYPLMRRYRYELRGSS